MAKMKDYWSAIFGHFMEAADRLDLGGRLKTADLPEDIKREQFRKIKQLKVVSNDVLVLPKGGFVGRFCRGGEFYICLQVAGLMETEKIELEGHLEGFGARRQILDESTFMFLALEYRDLYKPKKEHLGKESAQSVLAIADLEEYIGHSIDDLVAVYEDLMIFSVGCESVLSTCSKWFLAAFIVTSSKAFRSETFPVDLSRKLNELLLLGNANPENIYYAATSIHLRQCFMEIYRCLEGIFYLPWTSALKTSLGLQGSGRVLAGQLKSEIGWRQRELLSIGRLFSMVTKGVAIDPSLSSVKAFGDVNFNEADSELISRRIYKIRNILVHQEDFDDPTPIRFTPTCWPSLNLYLVNILLDLYGRFAVELDFTYKMDAVA